MEIASEDALKRSGVPYTIARNSLYSSSFKHFFGGNLLTKGVQSFGREGQLTFASIADLGEAAANLLTQPGHENKVYTLNANQTITFRQMAALWGEVLGKPVKYRSITRKELIDDAVSKGLPPHVADYVTDFLHAAAEGDFSEASPALGQILGREPESLRETFVAELKS